MLFAILHVALILAPIGIGHVIYLIPLHKAMKESFNMHTHFPEQLEIETLWICHLRFLRVLFLIVCLFFNSIQSNLRPVE